MVRTGFVYQLRSYGTEDEIKPVEILVPVQVRHLVLVHIERADGQTTRLVVTGSGNELVFLAYCKGTTLDRDHTYRVDITYTFVRLEIRSTLVEVIPARRVTYAGIQLTLLAR